MKSFLFRLAFDLYEKIEKLAAAGVGESVETITDSVSVMGHRFRIDLNVTRES